MDPSLMIAKHRRKSMKSGRKSIRKNLKNKIRMKTIGIKIHRIGSENVNKLMMENYQILN